MVNLANCGVFVDQQIHFLMQVNIAIDHSAGIDAKNRLAFARVIQNFIEQRVIAFD